jgi:class 3 adenylate cyclase
MKAIVLRQPGGLDIKKQANASARSACRSEVGMPAMAGFALHTRESDADAVVAAWSVQDLNFADRAADLPGERTKCRTPHTPNQRRSFLRIWP